MAYNAKGSALFRRTALSAYGYASEEAEDRIFRRKERPLLK